MRRRLYLQPRTAKPRALPNSHFKHSKPRLTLPNLLAPSLALSRTPSLLTPPVLSLEPVLSCSPQDPLITATPSSSSPWHR
ncbi:hypothetical protein M0R45_026238 [Rubus argutus]|uniref:Uncharacterized protein n=1 Tax=Rubus argutus TaxID=59490 RepID=A0AAW1X0I2_RUBAR